MSERINKNNRYCLVRDLGTIEYTRALALQTNTRDEKLADRFLPDLLILVEHDPVFTLGKNGGRENLMVSDTFLDENGVTVVQTDRGGNITYHGPGQVVVYPVVDLERAKIGVADYVNGLENMMIRLAEKFNIQADRNSLNHGVWVESKKIGSVGLSIKKGISIHGLAMNVNSDLTPFSWINPCGLNNVSMTSIDREIINQGRENELISMDKIKNQLVEYFCDTFDFQIIKEEVYV